MTRADEHPLLETLSAHVDGEIAAPEVPALEEHLRRCADCRRQLDDLRVLAAATADEEAPPVPAGLAARISARLDDKPAAPAPAPGVPGGRRRHLPPWLWRGGPLAAAASVLGAAILWRVWLAGPALVEPLKIMAPSAPVIEKKERRKAGGEEPVRAEPARQDALSLDAVRGFASQAAESPVDERLGDEDAATATAFGEEGAAAAPADDQLLDKDVARSRAMVAEGTADSILLQMEEGGAAVSLTRNGDLQVLATGYRCRIRINMEGLVMPEPEDEAASRDLLLRLVRRRYRADLEKQCGPLPPALAPPPQN